MRRIVIRMPSGAVDTYDCDPRRDEVGEWVEHSSTTDDAGALTIHSEQWRWKIKKSGEVIAVKEGSIGVAMYKRDGWSSLRYENSDVADKPLFRCSFCIKTQKEVKKLVAGPGVCVCDECIDRCNEIISAELKDELAIVPPTDVCSFCSKDREAVKRLITGSVAVKICDECVELSNEIIEEEVAGPPVLPS